jgi:predicted nucleotidyltransferase component of viral defense system
MIPKPAIAHWQNVAPWADLDQVEQDLLISRMLVAIFSDHVLSTQLAFRGGTALHKLHLNPAPRYSEDIDLVQLQPGPIKPILDRLRKVVAFFDRERSTQLRGLGVKVLYRYRSTYGDFPVRIKLEINCREHFHLMPLAQVPFAVHSPWFSGQTHVPSFDVHELLGTKLRALYQRCKGRDLFDLHYAYRQYVLDWGKVVRCFQGYIQSESQLSAPTAKQFALNLTQKCNDPSFMGDMEGLLRPGVAYDQQEAADWLMEMVLPLLDDASQTKCPWTQC